jgi:hypothetical protein
MMWYSGYRACVAVYDGAVAPEVLLLVLDFPKMWEDWAHVEDAHMAVFQFPLYSRSMGKFSRDEI